MQPEANEPPFHADWEGQVLALTLAMGATGRWSIDESRHARETLPPTVYLSSSYFRIWLLGLQKLMLAHGLVSADELETGRVLQPPGRVHGRLQATRSRRRWPEDTQRARARHAGPLRDR
ncbi:MAG: nitrile hydratase subunit beta [Burkholderiaceae bacterium]